MIQIRRASIEDAAALKALAESLLGEKEPWIREIGEPLRGGEKWIRGFIKDDREHSSHGGKFLFFAFDGDRLVGHVNGTSWAHAPKDVFSKMVREYDLEGERPGHVGIAVRKDYRRKGLGRKLMQEALQELREMGASIVIAGVNVDNKPSLSFFDKNGFSFHKNIGEQAVLKKRI